MFFTCAFYVRFDSNKVYANLWFFIGLHFHSLRLNSNEVDVSIRVFRRFVLFPLSTEEVHLSSHSIYVLNVLENP